MKSILILFFYLLSLSVIGQTTSVVSKVGVESTAAASDYELELLTLQALGSPVKAKPALPLLSITANTALTDGRCTWTALQYVTKATVITGVAYFMGTQGNFTGDNYNGVGLYSYSGGTLTLVDTSTRDEAMWKITTGTWGQKAFAGGARTIQPGQYFILSLYNSSAQSVAPTLATVTGNTTNGSILTTNSAKLFSFTSSIATPAATQAMSGTTIGTYYALSLY